MAESSGGQQSSQPRDSFGADQAEGSGFIPDDGDIPKYPEPQQRAYYLDDLFGKAAYLDAAYTFEQSRSACLCLEARALDRYRNLSVEG